MQWNPKTHQYMVDMITQVVPEAFRDTALDGLQTDAEKSATKREATEIEDQDLILAVSQAPGFIQSELYNALKRLGLPVEHVS